MIVLGKKLLTISAGAVLLVGGVSSLQGQGTPQGTDAFNFPEDISFMKQENPDHRRATARINGNIITGTDVDHRLALIVAANDGEISSEEQDRLRQQILRNLIDETLQVQEAAAQDMEVSADEVNSSFDRFAQQGRGMTTEELGEYLRSIGSSPRSLKRQIQGELAWDRLLQRNVIPFVNVSEAEADEILARINASRGNQEYRVGEIFLNANSTNLEQVSANASQIVEQLRAGGSFVGYARQYSEASTAAVGGDLGWIQLGQLQNPLLEGIVADMSPGQLVGPVEIPGGLWLGLLIDKRQIGMADPRDAVLSLKQISLDFPAGTSTANAEARSQRFIEAIQSMNGCGDADVKAGEAGATVVNNDQIQVRALPDALQPVVLELNVGQTTPPFGDLTEGIRVLMICGRDDPAEVSGPDKITVMNGIKDERVQKRAQNFLRDLRRDALIEYN